MIFTVLGANGFIGRHLYYHLTSLGHEVFAPARDDPNILIHPLGHVIYCIGLTADFRQRPFDTLRAHISLLAGILEHASFDTLLYLSSTRVYARSNDTRETAILPVNVADPSDLYNISKLMGESICLNCGRNGIRVVRLSNVVGFEPASDNFLAALIREAVSGRIQLRSALASAKDYIALDDVLALLPRIAVDGKELIYNVAHGRNIANQVVTDHLQGLTGCVVEVVGDVPPIVFPTIDVMRVHREFETPITDPCSSFSYWLDIYRQENL